MYFDVGKKFFITRRKLGLSSADEQKNKEFVEVIIIKIVDDVMCKVVLSSGRGTPKLVSCDDLVMII